MANLLGIVRRGCAAPSAPRNTTTQRTADWIHAGQNFSGTLIVINEGVSPLLYSFYI